MALAMNDDVRSDRKIWAWTALLTVLIEAADALTPDLLHVGILYVGLVLLSRWSSRRSFTYFVAAVGTCFVLRGLFAFAETETLFWVVAVNRLLIVSVIWMTAFLCVLSQRKEAEDSRIEFERARALAENEVLREAKESLEKKTQQLIATQEVAFYTLAKMAELRDSETGQHLERIRAYSHILALELQKDPSFKSVIDDRFLNDLYRSSPLHDIGKVAIPDAILRKAGKLTEEEYELMKRHTIVGAAILEDAISHKEGGDFFEMAAVIAKCHHERFDGTGYPLGLSSRSIPLVARIVAVADVFDALTSERHYKDSYSPEKAREIIVADAGRHFDPVVVEAFERRYEDFLHIQLRYPNKYTRIFGITESLLAEICK